MIAYNNHRKKKKKKRRKKKKEEEAVYTRWIVIDSNSRRAAIDFTHTLARPTRHDRVSPRHPPGVLAIRHMISTWKQTQERARYAAESHVHTGPYVMERDGSKLDGTGRDLLWAIWRWVRRLARRPVGRGQSVRVWRERPTGWRKGCDCKDRERWPRRRVRRPSQSRRSGRPDSIGAPCPGSWPCWPPTDQSPHPPPPIIHPIDRWMDKQSNSKRKRKEIKEYY